MDKKISRTIDVLTSLQSYFESLRDYLKQTDHDKLARLEKSINQSNEFKDKFTNIIKSGLNDSTLFESVHLYASLTKTLQIIYNDLDFQLSIGEEISKTRAYRLSEVFNKITNIYRIYIRDLASEFISYVEYAAKNISITSPLDIQTLWHKYPLAIDLYVIKIKEILNTSYKTNDRESQTLIFEILDSDKRFILEETQWLSPFLTLNCIPFLETIKPIPFAILVKIANLKNQDFKDQTDDRGFIVITRQTLDNKIHLLPKSVGWGPGITSTDVNNTLVQIETQDWKWSIKIHDTKTSKEYIIIEQLGENLYRILVPWTFPIVWIKKDVLIQKIKEKAFGRPNAYHHQLDNALHKILDNRVANLVVETARTVDVGLNVLRVTDLLLQQIKHAKGSIKERLDEPILDIIFETAILNELNPKIHLLDALLYWTEWSRRDFRKELNVAISHETFSDNFDTIQEYKVQTLLHHVVVTLINKNDNIFQDLFNKQHKLDIIKQNTKDINFN